MPANPCCKFSGLFPDLPDLNYDGTLKPQAFRELLLERGAILLRNGANIKLLKKIEKSLSKLFNKYSKISEEDFDLLLKSSNEEERNFWQQIKLSHIYDDTFKKFTKFSYFKIIKESGLWELAAKAWPEFDLGEARTCHSRRVLPPQIKEGKKFFLFQKQKKPIAHEPLSFHVDAQYHYPNRLALNFWTPLTACGKKSPGLKVALLGIQETKKYLEFNPAGYEKEADDFAFMHLFKCKKMKISALKENNLLQYIWIPQLNKGDILVFTNFTMHATHITTEMTKSRTSVEVRVDLHEKKPKNPY